VRSRVDKDGVLTVSLPLGASEANRDVQVTVEPVPPTASGSSPAEWKKFLDETAGQWQGELERPPQGEYETRDSWQ
jgi:hypothetical protein